MTYYSLPSWHILVWGKSISRMLDLVLYFEVVWYFICLSKFYVELFNQGNVKHGVIIFGYSMYHSLFYKHRDNSFVVKPIYSSVYKQTSLQQTKKDSLFIPILFIFCYPSCKDLPYLRKPFLHHHFYWYLLEPFLCLLYQTDTTLQNNSFYTISRIQSWFSRNLMSYLLKLK